jgi:hypothetical protein
MRYPIPLTIVLVFLAGSAQAQLAQPPAGVTEGVLKEQPNACPANSPVGRLEASPVWSGWGGAANATNNARFQTKANAGLASTDVPKLKLKWAFGLPGATSMYSQPAVAFGRVFLGGDNGMVYSLDAKTGCLYWAYQADMFGRFAPIAAPISGHPGTLTTTLDALPALPNARLQLRKRNGPIGAPRWCAPAAATCARRIEPRATRWQSQPRSQRFCGGILANAPRVTLPPLQSGPWRSLVLSLQRRTADERSLRTAICASLFAIFKTPASMLAG